MRLSRIDILGAAFVGLFYLAVFFCVFVFAGGVRGADLPVTYNDCRTRSYPKMIVDGDTLTPGVWPDTFDVELDEVIPVSVLMGVDDSTNGHGAFRCNCQKIEALWDSSECTYWFFRFRIVLYKDQSEPPDWARQTEKDTLRNIDTVAVYGNGSNISPGECTSLIGCPHRFDLPDVSFSREGVGSIMVRGRLQNYLNNYIAPAGDTCKAYFRVKRQPVDTGTRVMVNG